MFKRVIWQPDLPDFRDYPFVGITAIESLPESVDLSTSEFLNSTIRPTDTPILEAFSFTIRKDLPAEILDPLLRVGFGRSVTDGPYTSIRNENKVVIKNGLKLTEGSLTYYRLTNSLDAMKQCLADGYPFVFGYTSYATPSSALPNQPLGPGESPAPRPGTILMPKVTDSVAGSKIGLAIGYDNVTQYVKLKAYKGDLNDNGYLHMPYDYISNVNICDDFWTLRKTP